MKVTIGDKERQVHLTHEETRTSVSTRRQLRKFKADVSFLTPRDEDAMELLKEDRPVVVATLDDGTEVRCAAKVLASSYRDGDPHRHYSIDLEEVEELVLDRLEFASQRLIPTAYREDLRDGLLTCHVEAEVSGASLEQFWRIRGASADDVYFDVTRHGITEEPRSMRFGRILWHPLADERERVLISFVLVEKAYDDDPENRRFHLHGPEISAVQEATAHSAVLIAHLLDVLVDRSIVTAEDAESLRRKASDEEWDHRLRYYRVDDFDDWT